jgi:hypothetical protein
MSGNLNFCYMHATRPGTDENTPPSERYYQLFSDPAYGVSPILISPFSGSGDRTEAEQEFNELMSAVRIEVEHGFGGVTSLWPFMNAWWKHQIWGSPIGHYYCVAVLLTNAHNCYRPNQTAEYLQVMPPVLEEYFHH